MSKPVNRYLYSLLVHRARTRAQVSWHMCTDGDVPQYTWHDLDSLPKGIMIYDTGMQVLLHDTRTAAV